MHNQLLTSISAASRQLLILSILDNFDDKGFSLDQVLGQVPYVNIIQLLIQEILWYKGLWIHPFNLLDMWQSSARSSSEYRWVLIIHILENHMHFTYYQKGQINHCREQITTIFYRFAFCESEENSRITGLDWSNDKKDRLHSPN